MTQESSVLIRQARAGDRPSLERLLISHTNGLRGHISRGVPARYRELLEVDDVVQEVLIKAFQNIGQLRECSPAGFQRWLMAIGDLTLIDAMRAASAQKRGGHWRRKMARANGSSSELCDILKDIPGDWETGSSRAARREALAALRVCVARLPESQRRVIQLRYLEGHTIEDTAKILNRTSAGVRSLMHRAKQNLAEAMGRASAWLSSR